MDFIVLINVLIPPFSKTLSLSLLIPNILPSCYFQYHMCFSILLLSMFTCVPISRSFFMYISFISVNPYPVPLFHIPVIPSVPHLCCYFTYSLLFTTTSLSTHLLSHWPISSFHIYSTLSTQSKRLETHSCIREKACG